MPRTETITRTLYAFHELTPAAQERARADYAQGEPFSSADDYLASLTAFAAHFGAHLRDYQINWDGSTYSSATFDDLPDLTRAEIAEMSPNWARMIRSRSKATATVN